VSVRWWRVAIVFEDDGAPHTWTFHVRALTEKRAEALVRDRVGRDESAVDGCFPSEPLPTAIQTDEIVADWGPYRRSWNDPTIAHLKGLLR
jgi:hypothetical protein